MLPKQTSLGVLALNFDSRNDLVPATSQLGTAVIPNNIDPENRDSYSHVYGFSLFDETGQEHAVRLYFRRVTPKRLCRGMAREKPKAPPRSSVAQSLAESPNRRT